MAAVPFGFSFGDFVAGAKLITDIAKALRATGGASFEYQAAAAELESLDRVLQRIAGLKPTANHDTLNTIRALVFQCHFPLRQFLKEMQKFEIPLGARSNRGPYSHISRKAQWALSVSKKVEKLKAAIGPQLATINALLELQVLENQSRMESQQGDLLNRAITLNTNIEAITKMMEIHNHAVMNLLEMRDLKMTPDSTNASGHIEIRHEYSRTEHIVDTSTQCPRAPVEETEARQPTSKFGVIVAGKLVTGRNIGEVLHEILRIIAFKIQGILFVLLLWYPAIHRFLRTLRAIRGPLMLTIRDNIQFEDAFGELKVLSYNCFRHWEVFESFLKCSFKDLPGEAKVRDGQFYLMSYRLNGRVIKRDEWEMSIVPGSHIVMSMIFNMSNFKREVCPRPNCKWKNDVQEGQTYTTCQKCGLTYFLDKDPFESAMSSWEHLSFGPNTPRSIENGTLPSDSQESDSSVKEVNPALGKDDEQDDLQIQVFKKVHIRSDNLMDLHINSTRNGLKTKTRKLQVRLKPDSTKVRTWTDRSGIFHIEAQCVGYHEDKITLHKSNGFLIQVPAEKISVEDLKYLGAISETGTTETEAQIRVYPDPTKIRPWTDHCGSVDGQYLGFLNKKKIIIHSLDGNICFRRLTDLCVDDIKYVTAFSETNPDLIAREVEDVAKSRTTLPLPDPANLRTWTDRTGNFEVEAQLLRYNDGKILLHKSNGIRIDVPVEKISLEALKYLGNFQQVD